MLILSTTILLIFLYIMLDFLLSAKKNLVKNVIFGTSCFFFMFLIISEVLFALNYYSLFRAYFVCGVIALIIIMILFLLRYKGILKKRIISEKKQVIPPELFIILLLGCLLSVNRFELFGMGQDQGVYQIKAILMTEGDNDNYFTIKESELINNNSDREKLRKFIELQKAGGGFYTLKTNVNRGTMSVEQNDLYTGIFHGLPNFPALLSIAGKIFGVHGIMYMPALFYLLSVILIFLICYINLELKRSTSDIITFLFMLSPIVVWVSKSTLTENVLTLIILMFIFLMTSKTKLDKWLLWFPVLVFSFTHVSIYTIMPMFIIVFVILILQEKEKSYLVAGIISTLSYLVGLIVMSFTSPQYTFDNYSPLLNLFRSYPNAVNTFPLAITGVVVALVILTGSYIFSIKADLKKVQSINFLNIIKILMVLGLLVVFVKWFFVSYYAAYDVQWNYYKNKGLIGSLQNITLFGYLIWSGIVLIPVNIFFVLKLKGKNNFGKSLLPLIFMFIYCIILYSAFLRFEIQYYYYYSRYLAPFLSIVFVLSGYFIDHNLKLKVFTGIISFAIFFPFTINLALYDDTSRIDFQSFVKTYQSVLSVEEKGTVVIDDSLSPYFFYPLEFQTDYYVFSDSLLRQMQDLSFLDGKKVLYLSTKEFSFSPIMSIPMKSSAFGISSSSFNIGGKTKITDLFRRKEEMKEVYLYKLSVEQFEKLLFDISSFASSNGAINKDVLISDGSPGFVLYGNYHDLNSGDYEYSFEIRLLENKSGNNKLGYIDIVSNRGKKEQIKIPLTLNNVENKRVIIKVPFHLAEQMQYIEGRVYVDEGVKLEVGNVELKTISKN